MHSSLVGCASLPRACDACAQSRSCRYGDVQKTAISSDFPEFGSGLRTVRRLPCKRQSSSESRSTSSRSEYSAVQISLYAAVSGTTLRAFCEYWRTPHRLHRCAARFALTAARCPVRTGRKASRATALVVFRSRSSRTVIFRAGSCIRCTFPGRI